MDFSMSFSGFSDKAMATLLNSGLCIWALSKRCRYFQPPSPVIQIYLCRPRFDKIIHLFLHSAYVNHSKLMAICFHFLPICTTSFQSNWFACGSQITGSRITIAYPGGTVVFSAEIKGWMVLPSAIYRSENLGWHIVVSRMACLIAGVALTVGPSWWTIASPDR
jgi:hypothetical protein